MESAYWHYIEPYWGKIDISHGAAELWASVEPIPSTVTFMYAAHFCLSEIHNGGFLQLFWNGTGILFPIATEALEMIGMVELAKVFVSAAQPLGLPYPLDRDERWDALLSASSMSEDEIKDLFATEEEYYTAFVKATEDLAFDALSEKASGLATTENGGFDVAADRHLATLGVPRPPLPSGG